MMSATVGFLIVLCILTIMAAAYILIIGAQLVQWFLLWVWDHIAEHLEMDP